MGTETIESAAADAVAAPLDLLLTDAALGMLSRVNPGGSGLRLAAALAARPRLVAGRTRSLLGELTRIAAGTSQVQPSRRDRRFADPGWAGNPLLRRAMQAYLAAAQTAEGLAMDADLDWSDTERVGFVLRNLINALAPSNNPVLNPAALKAAIDTGGGSALAGLRHFAADVASPPRIPSTRTPGTPSDPDSRHAKWDFNTYGQAVLDAMDAAARITGSEQTAITGVCSGGVIAAMVAAHLAHTGRQDQVHRPGIDQQRLGRGPVAAVAAAPAGRVVLVIAQVASYLLGQGPFQHHFGQLGQQPVRAEQLRALGQGLTQQLISQVVIDKRPAARIHARAVGRSAPGGRPAARSVRVTHGRAGRLVRDQQPERGHHRASHHAAPWLAAAHRRRPGRDLRAAARTGTAPETDSSPTVSTWMANSSAGRCALASGSRSGGAKVPLNARLTRACPRPTALGGRQATGES